MRKRWFKPLLEFLIQEDGVVIGHTFEATTTFDRHVHHIVLMVATKQMGWVCAPPVVTQVQNSVSRFKFFLEN